MTGRVALALTLALTGCMTDVGEGEDLTDTGFITPVAPHVAGNGMQQKDILGNGVVARIEVLKALIENPLRDESFTLGVGPDELAQLQPTLENQIFLRHLVECALDAKDFLKFQGRSYQGAQALAPDWHDDKPTQEELELVSGCMLAYNNNTGTSVLVSSHGLDIFDQPLTAEGPVRAYAYLPDPTATPLPSFFQDCTPFQVGATRNCGWPEDDAWVGTCIPGAIVNVGAGAKVGDCLHPLGSGFANPVIRTCRGKRACDFGSPEHIASNDNTCGLNPAVKFVCPSSGTFSVMLGSFSQPTGYRAKAKAKGAKFVVRGPALYDIEEGAFFGNIFDPEMLNPNVVVIPGGDNERGPTFRVAKGNGEHTGLGDDLIVLYEDAWSCHHPAWTNGDAYMTERDCAIAMVLPEGGGSPVPAKMCVAFPLGSCGGSGAPPPAAGRPARPTPLAPSGICQVEDNPVELGDFDYDDCADGRGNIRRYPITTFLDEPCDLIGEQRKDLCARK